MNYSIFSPALLICVSIVLFLLDPGNSTFYTDDEWLYIGTAYEMFTRGELWITYWLGEPAYYKPPLAYWMMMPFFALGSDPIIQGRIAIGLMSLLTVLLTWWIGKNLYGDQQGLLAGLLTATSLGFLTYGRVGMLDMPFTLVLTAAVACLVQAWQKKSGRWAGWFWAVAGLSVLIKGPVSAIILFVFCCSSLVFYGGWRLFFLSGGAWAGMATALVFIVSWPSALFFKGQFNNWYQFFIVGEHLSKFDDPSVYPAGTFLSYLLQWQFPWTLLLLAALAVLPFQRRFRSRELTLPILWGMAIILTFLIPRVRLPWYLLPVVPAASLFTVAVWEQTRQKGLFLWSLRLTALILLIPASVLALLTWNAPFSFQQTLFFGIATLSLFAFSGLAWRQQTVLAALAFSLFILCLSQGIDTLTDGRLPKSIATQLRKGTAPVAAARIETGRLSQQLWFFSYHLGRKVPEVRSADTIERFLSNQKGIVLISDTDFQKLQNHMAASASQLQILHRWNYWKESIPPEHIKKAVFEGRIQLLMEPLNVVGLK